MMPPMGALQKPGKSVGIYFLSVVLLSWAGPSPSAFAKSPASGFLALPKTQQATLDQLEKRTFEYFRDSANPLNGQSPDHWPQGTNGDYFSSIASVGFGLTAYGIGVERGWMKRDEAVQRTLATLRFFHNAPQGDEADATGAHGFFYHFLDMQTGKRYFSKNAQHVELSSQDTAILMGGVLFSLSYYDHDTKDESEIRELADSIYRNVDWAWFTNGGPLLQGGWVPDHGFDLNNYHGYIETTILYLLALGSPTHPVKPEAWKRYCETYDKTWGSFQGQEHLGGGPMFWHQYTHVWFDFRGIQDEYMRRRGIDYFENSRRATFAQREYAIHNPLGWKDYSANIWGMTASNGPRRDAEADEVNRYLKDAKTYYGYIARGVAIDYQVDDGTIAPTAAASSIAFAPEIAVPAILDMVKRYGDNLYTRYGFVDAFNPSFGFTDRPLRTGRIVPDLGWVDTEYIGIDQGPIVAMLENYRSDFVWKTMRKNPYIRQGLKQAGFAGGWLDKPMAK
jgi:hypothetical protein